MNREQLEQEVREQQRDALEKAVNGDELSLRDRALLMSGEGAPLVAGTDEKPALVLTLGAAGMTVSEKNYRLNALRAVKNKRTEELDG